VLAQRGSLGRLLLLLRVQKRPTQPPQRGA
jgi:hypothetical protein